MSEYLKITPGEFNDQYVEYPLPDKSSRSGLMNVLRQIRRGGAASALDKKFPPVPIISSLRTLRDGRRVWRSFFVDFANSTQREGAGRLYQIIVESIGSGDLLRMANLYTNLLEKTRSNYE